jgi:hypothetical protein
MVDLGEGLNHERAGQVRKSKSRHQRSRATKKAAERKPPPRTPSMFRYPAGFQTDVEGQEPIVQRRLPIEVGRLESTADNLFLPVFKKAKPP